MTKENMHTEKCIVQLDGGDGLTFLGCHGEYTPDIQEATIFTDELEAHIYIKHGLGHLARVRRIVKCTP